MPSPTQRYADVARLWRRVAVLRAEKGDESGSKRASFNAQTVDTTYDNFVKRS